MPGSPLSFENELNPQIKENFMKAWSLNASPVTQYTQTTINFFQGEFGYSFYHLGVPVRSLLREALPATIKLFLGAFVLFFFILLFGYGGYYLLSSLKVKKIIYNMIWVFSTWPALFLAPLIIYIFSFSLGWFSILEKGFVFYFFIVLTLALKPACQFLLLFLDKTDELTQSFLHKGLKAKGLNFISIYMKHFFKISSLVFFSKFPQIFFQLFTGSLFVESLFSLSGLGELYFTSIQNRDYPVCVSLTFVYGFIFLSLSFICDFLIQILDPRMREA